MWFRWLVAFLIFDCHANVGENSGPNNRLARITCLNFNYPYDLPIGWINDEQIRAVYCLVQLGAMGEVVPSALNSKALLLERSRDSCNTIIVIRRDARPLHLQVPCLLKDLLSSYGDQDRQLDNSRLKSTQTQGIFARRRTILADFLDPC